MILGVIQRDATDNIIIVHWDVYLKCWGMESVMKLVIIKDDIMIDMNLNVQ